MHKGNAFKALLVIPVLFLAILSINSIVPQTSLGLLPTLPIPLRWLVRRLSYYLLQNHLPRLKRHWSTSPTVMEFPLTR
jgi:hypothetical protein